MSDIDSYMRKFDLEAGFDKAPAKQIDGEIERLRAEVAALNSALTTTSEGNARLIAEVAALKGNANTDMNICSVCGIDRRQEACKGNPFKCHNQE